ncbi:MAG: Rap1a/Tai family immunity protein [Acidiferrobacterales bacterium]
MADRAVLKFSAGVVGVALLLIGLSSSVHAVDGKELAVLCEAKAESIERGVCIGYILGVAESLTSLLRYSGVCPSEEVTPEVLGQVVVTHLKKNTNSANKPAVNLIWSALTETWPCAGMARPKNNKP